MEPTKYVLRQSEELFISVPQGTTAKVSVLKGDVDLFGRRLIPDDEQGEYSHVLHSGVHGLWSWTKSPGAEVEVSSAPLQGSTLPGSVRKIKVVHRAAKQTNGITQSPGKRILHVMHKMLLSAPDGQVPRLLLVGQAQSGKATIARSISNMMIRRGRGQPDGPSKVLYVSLDPLIGGLGVPGGVGAAVVSRLWPTGQSPVFDRPLTHFIGREMGTDNAVWPFYAQILKSVADAVDAKLQGPMGKDIACVIIKAMACPEYEPEDDKTSKHTTFSVTRPIELFKPTHVACLSQSTGIKAKVKSVMQAIAAVEPGKRKAGPDGVPSPIDIVRPVSQMDGMVDMVKSSAADRNNAVSRAAQTYLSGRAPQTHVSGSVVEDWVARASVTMSAPADKVRIIDPIVLLADDTAQWRAHTVVSTGSRIGDVLKVRELNISETNDRDLEGRIVGICRGDTPEAAIHSPCLMVAVVRRVTRTPEENGGALISIEAPQRIPLDGKSFIVLGDRRHVG